MTINAANAARVPSLVSAVIPAHNAQRFIMATIGSAIAQTYEEIEIVIVDDGSTDQTLSLLKRISDHRVKVLQQTNQGVAASRNRAVNESNGEFIAFLDADDVWYPKKLEHQIAHLRSNPSCVAVGSRMHYQSPDGTILGVTVGCAASLSQDRIREGRLMPFPLSSLCCRSQAFQNIGGFDERLGSSIPGQVEDLDLVARLAALGRVDSIDEPLGRYTLHAESASTRQFFDQRKAARFVRERLSAETRGETLDWPSFSESYSPSLSQVRTDHAQALYRRAGEMVAVRRRPVAAVFLASAFLLAPLRTGRRLREQRLHRRWRYT